MIDYKEKIRKLLALAESPVEAEAKAALLKARQLMAEHKLTEQDIASADTAVIRDVTGITFNSRRDYWVLLLSEIIAPNYCCQSFVRRVRGKQTSEVGFVGFADDFEICANVYRYAVDCIQSWISAAIQGKSSLPHRRRLSDTALLMASVKDFWKPLRNRRSRIGTNGRWFLWFPKR